MNREIERPTDMVKIELVGGLFNGDFYEVNYDIIDSGSLYLQTASEIKIVPALATKKATEYFCKTEAYHIEKFAIGYSFLFYVGFAVPSDKEQYTKKINDKLNRYYWILSFERKVQK